MALPMNRDFLKLFTAMTISKLGDWFFTIALPLLVYDLTHSGTQMAMVFVVTVLPQVLFSLIGGALADQINKKKIMITGDLLSALIVSLVPLLYTFNLLQVWMVYVAAFLLASVSAFYHPSFESTLPLILKKEDYVKGNSMMKLTETIITFAGPTIAGLCIALFGKIGVLWIDSVSFAISMLILTMIRLDLTPSTKQFPKLLKPIQEGLQYVISNKVILSGALVMFGINFGYGAVDALMIYFLTDYKGLSSTELGLFFTLQALGPLSAAFLANRLKKIPRGNVILFCGLIVGAGELVLLLSASFTFVVVLSQIVVKGAATLLAINWFTLRQEVVPSHLLGRVVSSTRMLAFLSLPISGMIVGNILNVMSAYQIFTISGIIVVACTVIGFKTPLFSRSNPAQHVNVPH